jgi:hypothetical protein
MLVKITKQHSQRKRQNSLNNKNIQIIYRRKDG